MSKVIKFGIGFVTGRPNICKLINNTCKHLAEQVNKSDVKIELTIFILFDLQYQFTTRIDFYGLMPDVYKNVNIKYLKIIVKFYMYFDFRLLRHLLF